MLSGESLLAERGIGNRGTPLKGVYTVLDFLGGEGKEEGGGEALSRAFSATIMCVFLVTHLMKSSDGYRSDLSYGDPGNLPGGGQTEKIVH